MSALTRLGLWLWGTDLGFERYPFGPPERGIKNRIAWWAYHRGIAIDATRQSEDGR